MLGRGLNVHGLFSPSGLICGYQANVEKLFEFDLVIVEIKQISKRIPGIGSGKLFELIEPFFFSIS